MKIIIIFFSILLINFSASAKDCESSTSWDKPEISSGLCIDGDLFLSQTTEINKNLKLEISGKIIGQIHNTGRIYLISNNSDNLKVFSNPELVELVPKREKTFLSQHAGLQTLKYSGSFILLVILIYLLLYHTPLLKKRRIIKTPIKASQILREITMGTLSVGITFYVIFYNESFLSWIPFNKLFYQWDFKPWYYHVGSFILLMFIYDTCFFWLHYIFHKNTFLFKSVHFVHHLSVIPNPLTAINFNPLELIFEYTLLMSCSVIFPVHLQIFQGFFLFHTLFDIYKHCGHQILPLSWDRISSEWFLIGPNYHEVHHTKNKYHLGFFFPYWDKIMNVYYTEWEKPIE